MPDLDRMLQRQMSGTLNPASPSLVAASIEHSEKSNPRVANGVRPAGTQALPVDTKPKRGRPRKHVDRKAYKAEHERNRRAKMKEAK